MFFLWCYFSNDAKEEEKQAYESLVRDYKIMLETAKEQGIKNPEMYIPFEVEGDFLWMN